MSIFRNNDVGRFYNSNKKDKKLVLELDKDNYQKLYKISIHADSFFSLTSNLKLIENVDEDYFNLAKDFWTINIYDFINI